MPVFEATINPQAHPDLSVFLKRVSMTLEASLLLHISQPSYRVVTNACLSLTFDPCLWELKVCLKAGTLQ